MTLLNRSWSPALLNHPVSINACAPLLLAACLRPRNAPINSCPLAPASPINRNRRKSPSTLCFPLLPQRSRKCFMIASRLPLHSSTLWLNSSRRELLRCLNLRSSTARCPSVRPLMLPLFPDSSKCNSTALALYLILLFPNSNNSNSSK